MNNIAIAFPEPITYLHYLRVRPLDSGADGIESHIHGDSDELRREIARRFFWGDERTVEFCGYISWYDPQKERFYLRVLYHGQRDSTGYVKVIEPNESNKLHPTKNTHLAELGLTLPICENVFERASNEASAQGVKD